MSFERENAALQQKLAEIKARYQPKLQELSAKGKKVEDDYRRPGDPELVLGVDFDVEWKDVEMSFDVPSITMEDRRVSLDLPEVTSSRERISFDIPDVRMVDKKVGQYPEIYGTTVRWKDIIVSLPEPYMRRVDFSLDLPSVTMRRQEFVLGIPRLTMERVRWVVGLPQFKVTNINVKTTQMKEAGQALQAEGQQLGEQMKAEIDAEVAKFKAAMIAAAFATKTEVSNGYNEALGTIKGAIDELQRQGCDPIKVPTPSGDVNLRKVYDEMETKKSRSLAEFDQVAGAVG